MSKNKIVKYAAIIMAILMVPISVEFGGHSFSSSTVAHADDCDCGDCDDNNLPEDTYLCKNSENKCQLRDYVYTDQLCEGAWLTEECRGVSNKTKLEYTDYSSKDYSTTDAEYVCNLGGSLFGGGGTLPEGYVKGSLNISGNCKWVDKNTCVCYTGDPCDHSSEMERCNSCI